MVNQLANAAGQTGISAGLGQANAAQGMISGAYSTPQNTYNQALAGQARMRREGFTKAPRLFVEVDVVTNGFVLAVGNERMIAKDLEELQQHFTAQVASLLLDKDK